MPKLQASELALKDGSRQKGRMEGLIFLVRIRPEDFPWVFKRDGKGARVIATLEALAMMLAVRAFFPDALGTQKTKFAVIPSYTDNRVHS